METIFYRSSIKWFSHSLGRYATKHDALKAHLNYIEKSKDFRFCLGDANIIINNSKQADKRTNSRIAFSFVFALPNNLKDDQARLWMEQIRDIIADFNNMDKENIYLGYHDSQGISGAGNKHIHVVGVNLAKDGKSIKLGRGKDEPQRMNKELEKLVKERGYTIRKDTEGIRQHIGTKLRYDQELKNQYLELLKMKMELQKEKEIKARMQSQQQEKAQPQPQPQQQTKAPAPSPQQQQLIDNLKRNLAILRENRELANRYTQDLKSRKLMNWYIESKLSRFYQKCNEMEKYIISLLQNPNTAQLNKLAVMVQEWNQSKNDIFSSIREAYQKLKAQQQQIKQQQAVQKPEPQKSNQKPQQTMQKPNSISQELVEELHNKKSAIQESVKQLITREQTRIKQSQIEQDGVVAENVLEAHAEKESIAEQKQEHKQAVAEEQQEIRQEQQAVKQERRKTREEIRREVWELLTDDERQYVMEYVRKQQQERQNRKRELEPEPDKSPSPKLGF